MIERLKRLVKAQQQPAEADYEPIRDDGLDEQESAEEEEREVKVPFSWTEYFVFLLLGVAMLWAWYAPSACTVVGEALPNRFQ